MTGVSATGPAGRPRCYDRVARRLHWLNAICVVVTMLLGWGVVGAPRQGGLQALLITLHGSFGLVILALMALWASWRLGRRPPPLSPVLRRIEALLARATHASLLLLFVAMPLSGYVSLCAAGRPPSLFGVVTLPPLVAPSGRLSQAAIAVHLGGEFVVYALLAMHIAAALLHGVVRRDGVLEAMLPPPHADRIG